MSRDTLVVNDAVAGRSIGFRIEAFRMLVIWRYVTRIDCQHVLAKDERCREGEPMTDFHNRWTCIMAVGFERSGWRQLIKRHPSCHLHEKLSAIQRWFAWMQPHMRGTGVM